MVCIFCIAVLAIVAGALSAAALDDIEGRLEEKASGEVKRVSDTESVARFELTVDVGGKEAPVAVTLYKEHGRARIQVLTHELTPEEVQRLEDELAEAMGAKIVDRSSPEAEAGEPTHEHDHTQDAERGVEKDQVREAETGRRREPEPPRR